jgi:hypothetical protein
MTNLECMHVFSVAAERHWLIEKSTIQPGGNKKEEYESALSRPRKTAWTTSAAPPNAYRDYGHEASPFATMKMRELTATRLAGR